MFIIENKENLQEKKKKKKCIEQEEGVFWVNNVQ